MDECEVLILRVSSQADITKSRAHLGDAQNLGTEASVGNQDISTSQFGHSNDLEADRKLNNDF